MNKSIKSKKSDKQTKGKIVNIINNSNLDAKSSDSITTKVLSPYEIFTKCINRSENLLSFQECNNNCQKRISMDNIYDCYRAAVFLSISALDNFIRTIISIKIKNKVIEKKVPDELEKYICSIFPQRELFEAARKDNFHMVLDRVINLDFSKKSFQGAEKITEFFKLVGYKDIFDIVAKKINKHKGNLIKELNEYTDRRHSIAHRGDYTFEQTDTKELEITYSYAEKCIETIKNIVKAINEITEDKK
jgi:hypothetical protein